jgi:hypothetical protein
LQLEQSTSVSNQGQTLSDGTPFAVRKVLDGFIEWLQSFGTTSYDHQTFYSGPVGGAAKSLYYRNRAVGTAAVAPLVFCEAFIPAARRMFGKKLRFPIADAHYAMAFALLSKRSGDVNHRFAVAFLKSLEVSRSPGYDRFCWGYPFDWVTQGGTIKAHSPFITSTPYAFEAFRAVYAIDRNERWRDICRSIAEHAALDIKDFPVSSSAASAGYSPTDRKGGVVNAAAYRAWLLTAAAVDFDEERYWEIARRNINFVLEAQGPDGSWPYAHDGSRDFIDHFHTCFVLKALAKIESRRPQVCANAIARGVDFYSTHLFDDEGLPKPFAKAPRLTMYRRELYDYAECLNVCSLLSDSYPALRRIRHAVLGDFLTRWIKADGSFRSRELLVGWDNVPMHRWAQSQMFRSLAITAEGQPPPKPLAARPLASQVH